jgi:hypothetical protein
MKIFKLLLLQILVLISFNLHALDMANAKATYIYNFIRYVKWPESAVNKDFVIGVYGESDVYKILVELSTNRKVGTQNIVIKRVTDEEGASQCQLLFISGTQKQNIRAILNQIGNKPILLVSDISNTSDCTIEFVYPENKLQFKINEEKAKQQNLYLSQALLKLSN